MGFYDNNPGAKDAFATAGAIHDGTDAGGTSTTSDAVSPTGTAAVPTDAQRMQFMANEGFSDPNSVKFGADPSSDPMYGATAAGVPASTLQLMAMNGRGAVAFDDGGAMPEDDDSGSDQAIGADPDQSSNMIDQLFAHGRQKLGIMKQAGAIPMQPGTQSPSQGQPMPGPLPPTSNPFGKRPTPPTPGRLAEVVPGPQGGKGPTTQAIPYYMGKQTDPKVQPIPMKTSDAGAIPEGDDEEEAV